MGFQETFKALSDGTRRRILGLLKGGSLSAGEIGQHFDMTGATISHHLSILKDAGLVTDEKRGKYVYYELNLSVFEELISWLQEFKEDLSYDKNDPKQ
ncbi:MAG TPA: autorepressor SdpR family transcription factor [Candidatus Anaerostipes avistercoris]|uniref:Autorepressor SdpR family transcription factor n=1 Tax=Candidatus Anaerostipes avistercoris TaxID=2838462 RepID=A0A9D2PHJ6_9FIRM|nr:autorepressor SdpR family transcription factor [uncultured Anaerostipes sp.]HJC50062.1 autorepressor SdpR family transcription factor [Candidatus Anaerostipes avistercoris]